MKRIVRTLVALGATLGLVAGLGTPSNAQAIGSITDIWIEGCDVVVEIFAPPGALAELELEVWDDGNFLGSYSFVSTGAERAEARHTVTTPVLQGAAGLGLYVQLSATDQLIDSDGSFAGADNLDLEACAMDIPTQPTRPPGDLTSNTTEPTTSTTQGTTTTTEGSTTTTEARPTTTQGTTSTTAVTTTTARPGTVPTAPGARPVTGAASYTG